MALHDGARGCHPGDRRRRRPRRRADEVAAGRDDSRVDLVLTDVHMPRMDGYRLIDAMRERISGSTPPAIAISARAGHDEAVRAADAGFAAHLTKPVDLNLLLDTIDRVIAV